MHKPPKITSEFFTNKKEYIEKMKHIGNHDQECIYLITLSPERRIIGEHIIAIGGFNSATFDIAVVFNRVLADKAQAFVIAHNHTNGMGIFSIDDVIATVKIIMVSQVLNYVLDDHLLFPYERDCVSLKSRYPNLFQKNFLAFFYKSIEKHMPTKIKDQIKGQF
jgi:DNA repair protein RadC